MESHKIQAGALITALLSPLKGNQLNNSKEETKRANISQISSRYEICALAHVTMDV